MSTAKQFVTSAFQEAGIQINGSQPFDIQIHNEKFFDRVVAQGSLGLGESYMDGWWDCHSLDEFMNKILRADIKEKVKTNIKLLSEAIFAKVFNMQSYTRAFEVGEKHYDVGNALYEKMLDKRLVYTCAYWKDAQNIDEAQEHKLDMVCKKLHLKSGEHILDIGCGWGSFAKYAAKNYGVKVDGITISKEQAALAKKNCEGLNVEIRLQDYRDERGMYDKIVSLGMIEHVGVKNYRTYMEVANRCLKDNGLFLVQTIGMNESTHKGDPWLDKYIFPNAMLPSIKQMGESVENLFVTEDVHNFGPDYDKTLMAWFENIEKHRDWVKETYGTKFYRMWKYYLLSCAGTFRSRTIQLWQFVFSKNPNSVVYKTYR